MSIADVLESIEGLDEEMMEMAQKRLDSLTKPLGSLGRLESFVKRLCGITRTLYPKVDRKNVIIMCADNGIVEEGVSSCPKSVTAAVTRNFIRGITGINVLSRHAGAQITVVDIGVDDDIDVPGILGRKIARGTGNMAKGPAMTREEAIKGIETGIEVVGNLAAQGFNLLGTGEMGIGNTSTSSAIVSVLAGCSVETVSGRGSGLTARDFAHKTDVIKNAVELNRPDPKDPVDVIAKVGGFDIAGLCGCFIGAAVHRIPMVVDGFISSAAAMAAAGIEPRVRDFIFPSHGSAEPGSAIALGYLGFEPVLNLGMRLGEGTGAALAFHVLDAAVACYTEMGTFDDASITRYVPLE